MHNIGLTEFMKFLLTYVGERHRERKTRRRSYSYASDFSEVDYHFVTECLFTQLLERHVRVVKHSSNGRALMQAVLSDGDDKTRRVRRLTMLTRARLARDASQCWRTEWNSTSINFFLRIMRRRPRGFSRTTHKPQLTDRSKFLVSK